MNPFSHPLVLRLIDLALEEDRVRDDITCRLTLDAKEEGVAELFTREPIVLCGVDLVSQIFIRLGWPVEISEVRRDGEKLAANERICSLKSGYVNLLSAERTILNFLMRLSAIATSVNGISSKHPGMQICDTRKTTPGWRLLEKHAVSVGGGMNHRMNLSDMILIKNNHVDARKGDLQTLLSDVMSSRPAGVPVEVEVRNASELHQAAPFSPEFIMLDNFTDTEIVEALAYLKSCKCGSQIEVSGGISPARLSVLFDLGVRRVSMGSLTYGAKSVDLAMHVRRA